MHLQHWNRKTSSLHSGFGSSARNESCGVHIQHFVCGRELVRKSTAGKLRSFALLLVSSFLFSAQIAFGQGTAGPVNPPPAGSVLSNIVELVVPSVSWVATGLTLTYTGGKVYPGAVAQSITGSTLTLTNTKNTCTVAAIQAGTDACNYVYWTSGSSLSTSTTYSTATAAGNIPLYACTTTGGNITGCAQFTLFSGLTPVGGFSNVTGTGAVVLATNPTLTAGLGFAEGTAPSAASAKDICYGDSTAHAIECALNNGSFVAMPQLAGDFGGTAASPTVSASHFTSAPTPNAAAGVGIGTAALPFGSLKLGTAATNVFTITPAALSAARAITLPDPGAAANLAFDVISDCGTSATCATPTTSTTPVIVTVGHVAMSSSTTVTVSGFPTAYTAATSFNCSASDPTHATYTWQVTNVSTTSVTITAGTSNSDTWTYSCVGY